jgi:pyruvate/2-oxoglutarate dehydrogenase complex dihydrolipoamide dehydrogenase (E3) component
VPREEREAKNLLFQIFKNKGIHIHTSHTISESEKNEITIEHNITKKKQKIAFDKVLVALGRAPNTKLLSLDTV